MDTDMGTIEAMHGERPPVPAEAMPQASGPGVPAPEMAMMWLSSPALPVGGFSYSEGLEAAVDAGIVLDEAGALRWLRGQLQLVLARGELPAAARAHAAWSVGDLRTLREVQSWVLTTRESAELRLQSQQMGRSMLDWLARLLPGHALLELAARLGAAPCWPVGFALGACALGLDARRSLQALGFAWLDNQVQAALRGVPLGQSSGQRLLHALSLDLPGAVAGALELRDRPAQWQSFSPMLAVLSARHETQYSRLFRS